MSAIPGNHSSSTDHGSGNGQKTPFRKRLKRCFFSLELTTRDIRRVLSLLFPLRRTFFSPPPLFLFFYSLFFLLSNNLLTVSTSISSSRTSKSPPIHQSTLLGIYFVLHRHPSHSFFVILAPLSAFCSRLTVS